MRKCDRCGQIDDGCHNAVGSVSTSVVGYHYHHWTHQNKNHHWELDLCPPCTDKWKGQLDALARHFKHQDGQVIFMFENHPRDQEEQKPPGLIRRFIRAVERFIA